MKYSVELKKNANKFILVNDIEQFIKYIVNESFDVIVLNVEDLSQYILYDTLRGVSFKELYIISKVDTVLDKNLEELWEC